MHNLLIYMMAMLLAGPVTAQTVAGSPPLTPSAGMTSVLQMGMGLLVIVGLILFLAWLFRRLQPGAAGQLNAMQVLAAIPLGHREKLVMVKVMDQVLILGVTPQHITRLHEMPLADVASSFCEEGSPNRFADILKQFTGRQP
jgi:flagellar protein FliO/FliZ